MFLNSSIIAARAFINEMLMPDLLLLYLIQLNLAERLKAKKNLDRLVLFARPKTNNQLIGKLFLYPTTPYIFYLQSRTVSHYLPLSVKVNVTSNSHFSLSIQI